MSDDKLSDERLRDLSASDAWGVPIHGYIVRTMARELLALRDEIKRMHEIEGDELRAARDQVLALGGEVDRLRKLEASLPASLRDAHAEIERLRASQNEVAVRELQAVLDAGFSSSGGMHLDTFNTGFSYATNMIAESLERRIAALRGQAKPPVDVDIESRTETVPAEPPKRSYTERAQDVLADETMMHPSRGSRLLALLIEMLEARGGAK